MDYNYLQDKQQMNFCLQRIANILLINGGFLDDPGLYTGEMGLVLFFFRYARYTGNELYKEYGFELIEKIQNKTYKEMPIDYKQGLSGIGFAIEYLVQQGFIEADTDEILEAFDNRIFSIDNMLDLSIEEIISIEYYAHWRMSGNSLKKNFIRQTIQPAIEREILKLDSATYLSVRTSQFPITIAVNFDLSLNNMDMGIQNGLAGLGMTLLTKLDGDDSWIALFTTCFNTIEQ